MDWKIYLSGEIHSNWRDEVCELVSLSGLNVIFYGPVTDHGASDDCGKTILGAETDKFWHDHKSAKINSIRTRKYISDADVVVVKFGEEYKQWNAAFEAGYAAALGKSLILMHDKKFQHALKEIDAVALAVLEESSQLVDMLKYVLTGKLDS